MSETTLLFDPSLIAADLARGAIVITPNRRLASRIRAAIAADSPVAPAAPVLAIADWIERLWQQMIFSADPLASNVWVLDATQESLLWEQAVRAGDVPLLRAGQAAVQAQSAFRTLTLWRQIPLTDAVRSECEAQPDSAMFLQWLDQFVASCAAVQAIAGVERDRRVVEAVRQEKHVRQQNHVSQHSQQRPRVQLPKAVVTVGFDDLPPLYAELLQAVPDCSAIALPNCNASAVRIGFDSLETQLQAAALWAQRELQKNPAGPVAIVVPDLNQQRTVVERVLLDVFTPEFALPQQARALPPINFSSGESLAQTPLVRAALQLLELAAVEIEREALLQIARSPFSGFANAAVDAQALFIEMICALRTAKLRSAQIRQCADAVAEKIPAFEWSQALHEFADRVRRERWQSAKYSMQQWSDLFSEALTVLGWPGERTLDSIEYQQHSHWQQALVEFARLDQISAPVDFSSALQRLRSIVQAQVFQPKTTDTPVQILGVLEAGGLQFKSLWICDMGDDRWPAVAAPNPLLPRDLQRRLRMPRCDAEREFSIAQKLTQSLLASAESIVVSYQNESEEVERDISPLFQALSEVSVEKLLNSTLSELLPACIRQQKNQSDFALDTFLSGNAPRWTTDEAARGGSALFKDQAACAFRAFATHRLGARALDEPVSGLDAAERGSIVHAALEYLWRQLKTQQALIALDESAQALLIQQAAEIALREFCERDATRLGPRFRALEVQRLSRLLRGWLEVERERGEFVVHALEQSSRVEFNGLPLRLRVDRIDRLRDGRFLIIDYKTKNGNCSINEWLGDRLDEPQLPLYSQISVNDRNGAESGVAGIAFSQVRLDKPKMIGVGDVDDAAFSLPAQFSDEVSIDNWDSLQAQWRRVLQSLAQQFIEGEAQVDPKSATTCDFCELDSICRHYHENGMDGDAANADRVNVEGANVEEADV
ncbi:MAG: PD-(D/E)XK nuclease family protein [Spongiibacteraceae bacterium]